MSEQYQEGEWARQDSTASSSNSGAPSTAPASSSRQPPQSPPEPRPQVQGIRVLRGASSLTSIDIVSMVWSTDDSDHAKDRIYSIFKFDCHYMVIDSGASAHCCYQYFAEDYPLAPLEYHRRLVNADGGETKQLGLRCVLAELTPSLYIWMKMKVCDVSHI